MNVYDFDKTIYAKDSSIEFCIYEIKKHPKTWLLFPKQLFGLFLYALRIIDTKKFKEYFFSFLNLIDDVDKEVNDFWNTNENKINDWYKKQRKDNDLIISASPCFLLENICKRLNVSLIATDMDKKTGRIIGENCKGKEKAKRFKEKYSENSIENFYSDSYSDTPMAQLAKNAYIIKDDSKIEWNKGGKI